MLNELARDRPETCLSELRLDRWCVGELEPAEREAVRDHLGVCARCRTRLEAIESDQHCVARTLPPLRRNSARQRWAWGVGGLAAAAAVLVIVLPLGPEPDDRHPMPGAHAAARSTRIKGDERLGFFVQRDGAIARGQHGDVVYPGDRLRFEVSTSAPAHVAVLSVDGAGVISVYHPFGPVTQAVDAGVGVLDTAVELDDTLGDESVIAVFCTSAVEVAVLRVAFEHDPADPRLPPGCHTDRLQLRKVDR